MLESGLQEKNESFVESIKAITSILSPFIRVKVVVPEAPVQVSKKAEAATTLKEGFVNRRPVEEGFSADKLLDEPVLDEPVPDGVAEIGRASCRERV